MYIVVVEDERGALVSEHELTGGQLNIGRSSENNIILASGSVSRNHGCIYLENGIVYIADMGSSNGVIVDDARIKGECPIDDTNRIRLGDYRIILEKRINRPVADVGINTAVTTPERAHGKLVVLNGPKMNQEVFLYEPVTGIGRTEENDVSFPDISISRHHARLQVQDDGSYILSDLGSSNGTFYNGRRLTAAARARFGDQIQFGNVACLLSSSDSSSQPGQRWNNVLIYGGLVIVSTVIGILLAFALV